MESERMLHPIINQIGVDTQNEVVKEEKRQRIDNAPYGALIYGTAVDPYLYQKTSIWKICNWKYGRS